MLSVNRGFCWSSTILAIHMKTRVKINGLIVISHWIGRFSLFKRSIVISCACLPWYVLSVTSARCLTYIIALESYCNLEDLGTVNIYKGQWRRNFNRWNIGINKGIRNVKCNGILLLHRSLTWMCFFFSFENNKYIELKPTYTERSRHQNLPECVVYCSFNVDSSSECYI